MTSGETVLITGVTRGLGLELTKVFCSKGIHVIGISRNCEELLKMKGMYPGFTYFCTDLSDLNEVDKLLPLLGLLPQINAMILNAAVYNKDLYAGNVEYLMNVNCHSQLKIVNELIKQKRCETFILMSTILAMLNLPDTVLPAYGESKILITEFILGLRSKSRISPKSFIVYLGPVVNEYNIFFERIYKALYPEAAKFIVDRMETSGLDFYYPGMWRGFAGLMRALPEKVGKGIMKIIR